jgi:hypothetical protein
MAYYHGLIGSPLALKYTYNPNSVGEDSDDDNDAAMTTDIQVAEKQRDAHTALARRVSGMDNSTTTVA